MIKQAPPIDALSQPRASALGHGCSICRAFAQALVTVFGTDSSIATLPVTLRCASEHGISEPVARFVLPLGATVNMNGTAFFEALTVIFIAQVGALSLLCMTALLSC